MGTDGRHQDPVDGSPMLLQEFVERRELHGVRCNHTPNNARAVPHVKRDGLWMRYGGAQSSPAPGCPRSAASTSSRCSPRCDARRAYRGLSGSKGHRRSTGRVATRASVSWRLDREPGDLARRDRVDQSPARVVDPVDVLRLRVGRREGLASLELVGERQHPRVPERDVAEHRRHRPVLIDREAKVVLVLALDSARIRSRSRVFSPM